jgi:hypothetical protein
MAPCGWSAQHLGKPDKDSPGENRVLNLRTALWVHQENQQTARQPRAAFPGSTDMPEIKVLLARVTSAYRQVYSLSRRPEQALEIAVRQTGRLRSTPRFLFYPTRSELLCAS